MEAASDDRWRVVHMLRNVTALALHTLSLGVLALWVRSSVWCDSVRIGDNWSYSIFGIVSFEFREPVDNLANGRRWVSYNPTKESLAPAPHRLIENLYVFYFRRSSTETMVVAPHWFVAFVFAALAFVLKPKPRLQFSLSDMLVLTTFAAVLVAGVASLGRLGA